MDTYTNLEKLTNEIKAIIAAIAEIKLKIGDKPPHYRLIDKQYIELHKELTKLQRKLLRMHSKVSLIKNQNQIPLNKSDFYGLISFELSKMKTIKFVSLEEFENKIESIYLLIDRQLKENDELYTTERKLKDNSRKELFELQNKISKFQVALRKTYFSNNEVNILIGLWEVVFENGYIVWRCAGQPCRFDIPSSRQWYNKLKNVLSYITHKRLTILLNYNKNQIVSVNGFGELSRYFEHLEIDRLLSQYDLGDAASFSQKILNRLENHHTANLYQLNSKSLYLKFLLNKQEPNYKIIPASEKRTFRSNDTIVEEDAFLFSFKLNNISYIIWENVEERRATHVFRCDFEKYEIALQKVYDYIVSPGIVNKREILHIGVISYFNDILIYCGSINHTLIDEWKDKVMQICQ
ncbi:hypothetical protein ACS5NO_14150 [Larkinella sp. GY13]|uniref:hypothetical protein n=1 Tax=Larkinella sp. GY13 TaxID=3453720 RepID=UPI003EEB60F5